LPCFRETILEESVGPNLCHPSRKPGETHKASKSQGGNGKGRLPKSRRMGDVEETLHENSAYLKI
jgi:hypothetical protein